jgi:hypothetical protein
MFWISFVFVNLLWHKEVVNDLGEYVDGPGDAKILITTNEHERIKHRAVYFLRNIPPEKPIKLIPFNDHELFFGEVAPCPFQTYFQN